MPDLNDSELVREFAREKSEAAFAALVRQHVNLVFATALRQVGDCNAAEEIAQNVFIALAQSAGKLGSHPTIAGWLHQTALNKSREWLRSELRRRQREQTAVSLAEARADGDSVWSPLVPLLDEALLQLRDADRAAVIMHFMEGRTFQEVGSILGVGEDTARKRVDRCLEQLTKFFQRQGFTVPALSATAPLFALASHIAPTGLAASITSAGLAAHSAATLTLKGALKIMAWTKTKAVIVAGVVVLLAAGTTIVGVKKYHATQTAQANLDSWRIPKFAPDTVAKAAPQVRILPTKFKPPVYGEFLAGPDKWAGVNVPLVDIVQIAYNWSPGRIWFPAGEPAEHYDFASTLPQNNKAALRELIKTQFNLTIYPSVIQTKAFVLKVQNPDAPGLKPHTSGRWNGSYDLRGHVISKGLSLSVDPPRQAFGFVRYLEAVIHAPVINETGLEGTYDIDLRWNEKGDAEHAELKKALLDQLGLSFELSQEPVQMLVVEDLNHVVGIGISLNMDTAGTLSVAKVIPDSPAADAGLTNGVIIQKIDAVPVAGKTLQECAGLIRGQAGTFVSFHHRKASRF